MTRRVYPFVVEKIKKEFCAVDATFDYSINPTTSSALSELSKYF